MSQEVKNQNTEEAISENKDSILSSLDEFEIEILKRTGGILGYLDLLRRATYSVFVLTHSKEFGEKAVEKAKIVGDELIDINEDIEYILKKKSSQINDK